MRNSVLNVGIFLGFAMMPVVAAPGAAFATTGDSKPWTVTTPSPTPAWTVTDSSNSSVAPTAPPHPKGWTVTKPSEDWQTTDLSSQHSNPSVSRTQTQHRSTPRVSSGARVRHIARVTTRRHNRSLSSAARQAPRWRAGTSPRPSAHRSQRITRAGHVAPFRTASTGAARYVRVHPGDTLFKIALRHGTTWPRLAELNHLSNPNRILAGSFLRVS